MISKQHLYAPICDCRYHKEPLFLVVQLRKNGFLSQVDMLKWEKLINTQQISSLLHHRGLLVFGYRIFLSLEQLYQCLMYRF